MTAQPALSAALLARILAAELKRSAYGGATRADVESAMVRLEAAMKEVLGAQQADGLSQAEPEVSALRASIPSAGLVARARDMGEFLAKVEADIPEPTCAEIDSILRDIAGPRNDADRLVRQKAEAPFDELLGFVRDVDTALWDTPANLESLRDANAQLRDGVCHLGSYCHEAGALLLELAQAIEARRAETQSGSVHESAVRQDAPLPSIAGEE